MHRGTTYLSPGNSEHADVAAGELRSGVRINPLARSQAMSPSRVADTTPSRLTCVLPRSELDRAIHIAKWAGPLQDARLGAFCYSPRGYNNKVPIDARDAAP